MTEKPGTRVELAEWPTTLVLEADADGAHAAALVQRLDGTVTHMRRDGRRWTADLSRIDGEIEVVTYRTDDQSDTGPSSWNVTIAGKSFDVDQASRAHRATILMVLYPRQGRKMLKISGDGYAFGIEAYARAAGLPRDAFETSRPPPERPSGREPQQMPHRPPQGGRLEGQGSGVSVGAGLIITNHHVVSGVDRLVIVHEGRRADAHVVLTDMGHDIALVRHDLPGLTAVTTRDPAESHLGEEILAAGYPLAQVLGDDLKLTYGNVSGLRGGGDVTCLQFTAAIASGSSGGALLDMSGRLVGLVSAALRHSAFSERGAASENVNFAVKASLVREMIVAAGRAAQTYAPEAPLGRAALAAIARECVVSVDCFREN